MGSRYKLLGPDYVEYVFVLLGGIITCQLYKLSSDQAQGTQQLKVGLSILLQRFVAGPPLLGTRTRPWQPFMLYTVHNP